MVLGTKGVPEKLKQTVFLIPYMEKHENSELVPVELMKSYGTPSIFKLLKYCHYLIDIFLC